MPRLVGDLLLHDVWDIAGPDTYGPIEGGERRRFLEQQEAERAAAAAAVANPGGLRQPEPEPEPGHTKPRPQRRKVPAPQGL